MVAASRDCTECQILQRCGRVWNSCNCSLSVVRSVFKVSHLVTGRLERRRRRADPAVLLPPALVLERLLRREGGDTTLRAAEGPGTA